MARTAKELELFGADVSFDNVKIEHVQNQNPWEGFLPEGVKASNATDEQKKAAKSQAGTTSIAVLNPLNLAGAYEINRQMSDEDGNVLLGAFRNHLAKVSVAAYTAGKVSPEDAWRVIPGDTSPRYVNVDEMIDAEFKAWLSSPDGKKAKAAQKGAKYAEIAEKYAALVSD